MGNKVEFKTVEDQRKLAHTAVDAFFNKLKANPDGTPVDEIKLHHEKEFDRTDKDGFVVHGEMFAVATRLKRPLVMPNTGFDVLVQESAAKSPSDRVYAIAHPSTEATNHLVQFLLDELGFRKDGTDEGDMLDIINSGRPFMPEDDTTISDIARRTNLSFRPIVECDDLPGSKEAVLKSQSFIQGMRDREAEAEKRYQEALATGLSDAEAREVGWPSKPEEPATPPSLPESTTGEKPTAPLLPVEHDIEDDGRHIAEVTSVPGAMAYGDTPEEAAAKAREIAAAVTAPVSTEPTPPAADTTTTEDPKTST